MTETAVKLENSIYCWAISMGAAYREEWSGLYNGLETKKSGYTSERVAGEALILMDQTIKENHHDIS